MLVDRSTDGPYRLIVPRKRRKMVEELPKTHNGAQKRFGIDSGGEYLSGEGVDRPGDLAGAGRCQLEKFRMPREAGSADERVEERAEYHGRGDGMAVPGEGARSPSLPGSDGVSVFVTVDAAATMAAVRAQLIDGAVTGSREGRSMRLRSAGPG
jgi:hypothetical protein